MKVQTHLKAGEVTITVTQSNEATITQNGQINEATITQINSVTSSVT
jgi:uncharacterized protein YicC (UPF0701 family)